MQLGIDFHKQFLFYDKVVNKQGIKFQQAYIPHFKQALNSTYWE